MWFMRGMLCRLHRSKSGMSTVLGTLFFVGIMFTSIIPLFMYVNQVNTYYNKTVAELNQLDQERNAESLEVYAYPIINFTAQTATLNIFIRNRCTSTISVVRVWVNDTTPAADLPLQITGISDVTVEGIHLPRTGYFNIWLVTERGNVFASQTNTIVITETGWSAGNPQYSINVVIDKKQGMRSYNVTVTKDTKTYTSTGSSVGIYVLISEVGYEPGIYTVTVTRTSPTPPVNLYSGNVTITPQNPSPWIYTEDRD